MKIKTFLRTKLPHLYKLLVRINNKIRNKQKEKKVSLGKLNPEKNIYIINVRRESLGLMGYYLAVLGGIKKSIEINAVPVVDLSRYKNPYIADSKLGVDNAWDNYFEQPEISLSDALKSKNVIIGKSETPMEANPRWFYEKIINAKKSDEYFEIISRYIRFNKKTQLILDKAFEELLLPVFERDEKILGIVVRGTDIVNFPGHSVQPSLEELTSIVKELMKKYDCSNVFVASDSNGAIEHLKHTIGNDKIIINECERYDSFDTKKCGVISEIHFDRENDEYLKGIEYLTTIYLLSKTNVLFGSLVGSTIGAICMNENRYEHIEIFDKGVY